MISLDTETTGVDFHHGARPFLVTIGHEDGSCSYWEWSVDPETRMPKIPRQDILEIGNILKKEELITLQNPKFDVMALESIDLWRLNKIDVSKWWKKVRDTLLLSHLLASNQPHDLTSLALVYLGVNIQPYEDEMGVAVNECRRLVRSKYPSWRIAKKDDPMMPSAKEKTWKFDMWLPRLLARQEGLNSNHPWNTVTREYACSDTTVTLPLYKSMEKIVYKRKLDKIYNERLKILPVVHRMEEYGITLSKSRLENSIKEYQEEIEASKRVCVNIAASMGFELNLPKSGNNNSLREFAFDVLKLPTLKASKKTGAASLDGATLDEYAATLESRSKAKKFVEKLRGMRKRATAVSYMESYKRFWLTVSGSTDFMVLHPSLNATGTDTLRFSSSNPNEQNISKKEGFNIRYCFGPAEGREWWSCDAKNIELRLPAYEAGEEAMIELFERPNDPPYFGSNHLLAFDVLYPELFAKHGAAVKKLFASSYYQWVKNGNFAVQYGAQEASGTADRAYHMPGAQAKIQKRLGKIADLNLKMIEHANKRGYVETMPDSEVDPDRGYPLLCTRSHWGSILPTVPLSYHVQGTAMWWMMRAMIKCDKYLRDLSNKSGKDYRIVMQVHDELVFDFPKGHGREPWKTNLPVIRQLQKLMEEGGKAIGVPTPTSCEYHEESWSEGRSL